MNKNDIVILNPVDTVLFNGVNLGYTSGGISITPEFRTELQYNQRGQEPVASIPLEFTYTITIPFIELNEDTVDFLTGTKISGTLEIRGKKPDGTEVSYYFYNACLTNIATINLRKSEASIYTITFRAVLDENDNMFDLTY